MGDKPKAKIEVQEEEEMTGGGDGNQVGNGGGMQAPIILRKNLPKLSGLPNSISVEDWIRSVEAYCAAHNIVDEKQVIQEARDQINFEVGPAKKVVRRKNFEKWEDFKAHLRVWLQVKPPEVHLDLNKFYSLRWNKKEEKFLDYLDNIRDALERLVMLKLDETEAMRGYYRYLESTIIAQLPDETRKVFLGKPLKVTDDVKFEEFVNEIQTELAKRNNKPPAQVLALEATRPRQNIRSGPTGTRMGDKGKGRGEIVRQAEVNRGQSQPRKGWTNSSAAGHAGHPTRWEMKTNLCGRCMSPTHYRAECRSKFVKCSICLSTRHEFRDCEKNWTRKTNQGTNSRFGGHNQGRF